MKVSYVIPVHNESKYITRCIDNIRRGDDHLSLEIIVCLSSSTADDTLEKLPGSEVKVIQCKATSRSIQMNDGARHSSGEIICFVHADVCLPNGATGHIVKAIDRGFEAGYFSYRFDKPSRWLRINSKMTRKDGLFSGGGDQSLFVTRKCFDRMNGFNPEMVMMEDFNFHDRMKKEKISYTIIPHDAIVSARKYDHNSYLRVNLVNGIIFLMYKLGASSNRLKRLYGSLLR